MEMIICQVVMQFYTIVDTEIFKQEYETKMAKNIIISLFCHPQMVKEMLQKHCFQHPLVRDRNDKEDILKQCLKFIDSMDGVVLNSCIVDLNVDEMEQMIADLSFPYIHNKILV